MGILDKLAQYGTLVVLLSALLAAFGAFLQSWNSANKLQLLRDENSSLGAELKGKSDELIEAQQKLMFSTAEIARKSDQLASKSDEVASLSKQMSELTLLAVQNLQNKNASFQILRDENGQLTRMSVEAGGAGSEATTEAPAGTATSAQ